jgi:hypothetical protein
VRVFKRREREVEEKSRYAADYSFYLLYLVQKCQYSKRGRGEEQVCGRLLVLLALLSTKVPVQQER